VLLGNHDAASVNLLATQNFNSFARAAIDWTAGVLKNDSRRFLLSLPLTVTRGAMTLVHATPYEPNMWYYITSLEEAEFNFRHFATPVCLIGHTHIPLIIVLDKKGELYVNHTPAANVKVPGDSRFLINVGSVGQPRDRNPQAAYALADDLTGEFSIRRVPYNIARAQASMRKMRLPEFLINRLVDGR
jgi:diadenosine tetraphosphatase ApaH/serine/threonine PP2A family protein phosphatase